MTVRRSGENDNREVRRGLGGWQLIAALAIIGAVGVATLLITDSGEAVGFVVGPLLLVLGAWDIRL